MIALLNCAIKMKLRLRFPANQVILMCGCPVLLVHHNCQQSWAETYSTSYYIYYYSSLILSLKLNMRSNESPRVPFVFWGMNLRSSQAKTNAKNANETLVKGTNRLREGHSLELIDDDDKKKRRDIVHSSCVDLWSCREQREQWTATSEHESVSFLALVTSAIYTSSVLRLIDFDSVILSSHCT